MLYGEYMIVNRIKRKILDIVSARMNEMGIANILSLLSGVALFLFGMSLMGDGLKKVAGNKLEQILYKLTNTPVKGVLLGMVVTAIIQSSSATSVMVVGFVNSGMMKVAQAIGIIMGANIGTSITGWILCLSYIDGTGGIAAILSTATISAIVAIIGIIFKMFLKKDVYKNVGDIMLGFAILMVGMQTMSGSVADLKSNEHFISMITMFSNPFMGILAGILITAVLQSASASVGILQALSVTGSITFATAFPITMGIGVGAACPVLLSSIGSNKNGKRTALVYLVNDLFGMVFWSVVFYAVNAAIGGFPFLDMQMQPVTIALLNTVFRVATVIMLLPCIRLIEKLVFGLIRDTPEDREEQADFDLLEERFLAYPALAINQSHRVMNGMAKSTRKNVLRALDLLKDYTDELYATIQDKEKKIDQYEVKLGAYLMQLTGRTLTQAQTKQVSKFLHSISDFERMGDHAQEIAEVAKKMKEDGNVFSEQATYELHILKSAVREIVELTVLAFQEDDLEVAARIEPLRALIELRSSELKSRHVVRLQEGKCTVQLGFAFNDLLASLDRIAAHCANIAVAMVEIEAEQFDRHDYVRSLREARDQNYLKVLESYNAKYAIDDSIEEELSQPEEAKTQKEKNAGKDKEKDKDKDKDKDKKKKKKK